MVQQERTLKYNFRVACKTQYKIVVYINIIYENDSLEL